MQSAYDTIYFELKQQIEDGTHSYRDLLPSESVLVKRYGCAHNTVRKALAALAAEGYIQPIHGKGVRVIYRPSTGVYSKLSGYTSSGLQTFGEAARQYGFEPHTDVCLIEAMTVDEELAALTFFEPGDAVVHFERVRRYNGEPLSRETNYFSAHMVEGITEEDAARSIYHYVEDVRKQKLVTSKRLVTIDKANEADMTLLNMGDADYVAVVRLVTFDGNGMLCEFSELRYHPSVFSLETVAIRSRIN